MIRPYLPFYTQALVIVALRIVMHAANRKDKISDNNIYKINKTVLSKHKN